jgi:hypothetical protein
MVQDTLDATCERWVAGSIRAPVSGFAGSRAGRGGATRLGAELGAKSREHTDRWATLLHRLEITPL